MIRIIIFMILLGIGSVIDAHASCTGSVIGFPNKTNERYPVDKILTFLPSTSAECLVKRATWVIYRGEKIVGVGWDDLKWLFSTEGDYTIELRLAFINGEFASVKKDIHVIERDFFTSNVPPCKCSTAYGPKSQAFGRPDGDGIACKIGSPNSLCTETYGAETAVLLKLVANPGYFCNGWIITTEEKTVDTAKERAKEPNTPQKMSVSMGFYDGFDVLNGTIERDPEILLLGREGMETFEKILIPDLPNDIELVNFSDSVYFYFGYDALRDKRGILFIPTQAITRIAILENLPYATVNAETAGQVEFREIEGREMGKMETPVGKSDTIIFETAEGKYFKVGNFALQTQLGPVRFDYTELFLQK